MIRVFENLKEYNTYTNDGKDLKSGDLYWVNETNSASFTTNNIDGEFHTYDMGEGGGGGDLSDYYTKEQVDALVEKAIGDIILSDYLSVEYDSREERLTITY